MSGPAILCVDDEPRVLESLENHLALEWEVVTATSGEDGLRALAAQPFAVVMSDMRMPGMNGATVLARVREAYPDTIRMLLTGHSDLHEAAAAINEGSIFRLLLKPCDTPVLLDAVAAAFRQHELLQMERTLLEQTLHKTVGVLTDLLGLVQPLAFSASNRITAIVRHALAKLDIDDKWQIEIAAMLSQLGCVSLEAATIEAAHAGTLDAAALAVFRKHANVARRMLERIPRLEGVAAIVGSQYMTSDTTLAPTIRFGCELLQIATKIDERMRTRKPYETSLHYALGLRKWDARIPPALEGYRVEHTRRFTSVPGRELRAEMTLEADVHSPRGDLWMTKGVELSVVAAKRLRDLAERGLIADPVLVSLPAT